jgi:hypothetical protein
MRIASGGGYQDHSIRLWNLVTGQQVSLLEGHSGKVDAVVFSAEGQFVISAGFDHRILIWDLTKQSMIAELGKADAAGRTPGSTPQLETGLLHLPATVTSHIAKIRNACADLMRGTGYSAIPEAETQGVEHVMLNGRPTIVVSNELLCADHFPGANCSNRGCDLLIWRQRADGSWRKVFHEHLHERELIIESSNRELTHINIAIHAGDRRCRPQPNRAYTSGESCNLRARYRGDRWTFSTDN